MLPAAGFSPEDRQSYRRYIVSNVIEGARALADAVEQFGLTVQDRPAFQRVSTMSPAEGKSLKL